MEENPPTIQTLVLSTRVIECPAIGGTGHSSSSAIWAGDTKGDVVIFTLTGINYFTYFKIF